MSGKGESGCIKEDVKKTGEDSQRMRKTQHGEMCRIQQENKQTVCHSEIERAKRSAMRQKMIGTWWIGYYRQGKRQVRETRKLTLREVKKKRR